MRKGKMRTDDNDNFKQVIAGYEDELTCPMYVYALYYAPNVHPITVEFRCCDILCVVLFFPRSQLRVYIALLLMLAIHAGIHSAEPVVGNGMSKM